MRLVFIAGKFFGANAWQIACNVHAAEAAALRVAELGGMPVCPHSLGRSVVGVLPETFWRAGCLELLGRCDGILLLPGWTQSQGASAESDYAEQHGIERFGPAHIQGNSLAFVRWLQLPRERGQALKDATR